MIQDDEHYTEESIRAFLEIDPLTQVVLRGHLLLEEHLNSILRSSLFNHSMFDRIKLSFHHKLLFAQAFAVSQRGTGMWELLAAFNTLRNSIAHSLDTEHKQQKFAAMRLLYLRELEKPEAIKRDEIDPPHILVMKAFSLCNGYLRMVVKDAEFIGIGVRGIVEHMRRESYQPDPK